MQASFPWLKVDVVNIFGINFYQTVVTSFISVVLFAVLVLIYRFLKKRNPQNFFVILIDLFVEGVYSFFEDLFWKIPSSARVYILFLFFFILWNNLIGVFWDMFAYVWPSLHHLFRPVTSDLIFNWVLAVVGVVWAILYWIKVHWISFFKKYIPYNGIGLVEKPKWIWWYVGKFFDIVLWLFIWFLELISEFVKMLSLALRLFWNILAGMILLWLIISATMFLTSLIFGKGVPLVLPLVVMIFEIFVSFLQALVFSLLVLVYFKLAEASHH